MKAVPRIAATLAGLALVGVPAGIAMATSGNDAMPSKTMVTPAYQQTSSPARHHNGRHCHRFGGGGSGGASTATPQV